MIELHPNAVANFDAKGAAVVGSLKPPESRADRAGGFALEVPVSATLTDADVISAGPMIQCDHAGDEVERYYRVGDETVAITGEAFQAAKQLAEQIHRTETFREIIALKTVLDGVCEWISQAAAGGETASLSRYVVDRSEDLIHDYTVLLPVYELYVERPFGLGYVRIRSFTANEINAWRDRVLGAHPDQREALAEGIEKTRRRFQGRGVVEFSLRADRTRALELARQHAGDALAVLRLFSPAMFDPRIQSHCALLGQERVERLYDIVAEDGELVGLSEAIGVRGLHHWKISAADVEWMRRHGLDVFDQLLSDQNRSPFSDLLFESIMLHSRGALEPNLTEKLIYAVVALETLLLRNETEPIQGNVSERLSFVVGRDLPSRKAIIKNTKAAYGLRSRFLHHGQKVGDVEIMNSFFHHVWDCLNTLTRNRTKWRTKDEFLTALDDRRLA